LFANSVFMWCDLGRRRRVLRLVRRWATPNIPHKAAIFRQVNVDCPTVHHDALEFPAGDMVLLTYLMEGQEAVVLQLPATGS
jgi:hypothetical protein